MNKLKNIAIAGLILAVVLLYEQYRSDTRNREAYASEMAWQLKRIGNEIRYLSDSVNDLTN